MNHNYPECLDVDLEQLAMLDKRVHLARKTMATPQSEAKILRRHNLRRFVNKTMDDYGLGIIIVALCVAGLVAFVAVTSLLG